MARVMARVMASTERRAARPYLRAALLAAAAAASILTGCGGADAPKFNAIDITGAKYASGFTLPDFDGKPRTLADFRGKVTAVFFGFTQCPDVCPTTLLKMKEVQAKLGADAGKLQVVFITVDPERDTPAVLKQYVTQFDPQYVGLAGSLEETAAVAKEFKVFYQKSPGKTPTSYSIDHTALTYVFDAQGRIRLAVKHDANAEALAADIRRLIGGA